MQNARSNASWTFNWYKRTQIFCWAQMTNDYILILPLLQGFSVASSGCASRSLSTFLVVDEEVVDEHSILVQTFSARLSHFLCVMLKIVLTIAIGHYWSCPLRLLIVQTTQFDWVIATKVNPVDTMRCPVWMLNRRHQSCLCCIQTIHATCYFNQFTLAP